MTEKEEQQAVFDRVSTHLRKQGKPSVTILSGDTTFTCAYRGDDGLQCSAGCLIPDDMYDPQMDNPKSSEQETTKWWYVSRKFDLVKLFKYVTTHRLIADLQIAHDSPVSKLGVDWACAVERSLEKIALTRGLKYENPVHF